MFAKHFTIIFIINFIIIKNSSASPVGGYVSLNNNDLLFNVLPTMQLERFGNSIYYFASVFKGNYYQGMQFCKYHNMDLVSIETREENDFLFSFMQSYFGNTDYMFWTSGTTDQLSDWIWMATGKPIIFANWLSNQPDNAGGTEKHLEVRYSLGNRALMWNDRPGTFQNFVICELTVPKDISNIILNICNGTVSTPTIV